MESGDRDVREVETVEDEQRVCLPGVCFAGKERREKDVKRCVKCDLISYIRGFSCSPVNGNRRECRVELPVGVS